MKALLHRFSRSAAHRTISTALIVTLLAYCSNAFVSASCQRECDDELNVCLLTGALFQRTPDGAPSDFFSLLFLSCRSAYFVCEDSCAGAVGRL